MLMLIEQAALPPTVVISMPPKERAPIWTLAALDFVEEPRLKMERWA